MCVDSLVSSADVEMFFLLDECRPFGCEGDQFARMNNFNQIETIGNIFALDDRQSVENASMIDSYRKIPLIVHAYASRPMIVR